MKDITRKTLPSALVQALGAGVALSVIAAGAHAQTAQRVEKIEVTGSHVKRLDTETVAPVEVITREQIQRSGAPTVAEFLRNIPANTGGSFSESFTNSFASGASGISLRGLGQKATLVLLNGRRVTGFGFAQNLQDTFVDLNSIPTAAIERIEVLKDGASAIYGSDAIAGVVNIILRKDYRGVEATAQTGYYEGKHDYRVGITAGTGDLSRDGYNVFGTVDYYKRDLVLLSDTKFGASRDYRYLPGGRNNTSLTAGGTWRQLNAAGTALTNNFRAISECAQLGGTVLTGPQAVEQGLLAATSAQALATNTFCSKDINNQLTALPKAERVGFLGRATKEFSANATGYAELALSRVENFQTFTAPFFNTTALRQTGAGLSPFAYTANFAPGAGGNPFSTLARITGNMQDFGTRDQKTVSDTVRVLAGLTYAWRNWDLDSAIGWSRNEVDQSNLNRISLSGTSGVLGIPPTLQPPVPTVTNTPLNLDRPSLTSDATRDAMRINVKREAKSELSFADTKASTEFGRLPGGAIGLAVGAEVRREKLNDRPDPAAQNGEILGQGITATDGSRNSYAGFAEVSLPITRIIEANVAGRYDHYSDYGSSSVPKFGLKIRPTNSLLLRANWGRGFRAPTLPEISPSVATFFVSVNDPVTGLNGTQISGVFAGNPSLKAEKSESGTAGFVFEPTTNMSFGANYFNIDWKDLVSSDSFQELVNQGDPTRVIRDPVTNQIVTVFNNYRNIGHTKVDGVDVEGRVRFPTSFGRWTTRLNFTYIDTWKQDDVEYAGTNGQGTSTIPRLRGYLALDWDYRAFSSTVQMNYTRHYLQQLLAGSFFVPGDPRFQNQAYPERVPSRVTYDLYASYNVTKNLQVFGSILNVSDKVPYYDPGFDPTGLYDFSIFDPRGRQFRLGLTWKM
jgi:iron complex outermembrane receptor protein